MPGHRADRVELVVAPLVVPVAVGGHLRAVVVVGVGLVGAPALVDRRQARLLQDHHVLRDDVGQPQPGAGPVEVVALEVVVRGPARGGVQVTLPVEGEVHVQRRGAQVREAEVLDPDRRVVQGGHVQRHVVARDADADVDGLGPAQRELAAVDPSPVRRRSGVEGLGRGAVGGEGPIRPRRGRRAHAADGVHVPEVVAVGQHGGDRVLRRREVRGHRGAVEEHAVGDVGLLGWTDRPVERRRGHRVLPGPREVEDGHQRRVVDGEAAGPRGRGVADAVAGPHAVDDEAVGQPLVAGGRPGGAGDALGEHGPVRLEDVEDHAVGRGRVGPGDGRIAVDDPPVRRLGDRRCDRGRGRGRVERVDGRQHLDGVAVAGRHLPGVGGQVGLLHGQGHLGLGEVGEDPVAVEEEVVDHPVRTGPRKGLGAVVEAGEVELVVEDRRGGRGGRADGQRCARGQGDLAVAALRLHRPQVGALGQPEGPEVEGRGAVEHLDRGDLRAVHQDPVGESARHGEGPGDGRLAAVGPRGGGWDGLGGGAGVVGAGGGVGHREVAGPAAAVRVEPEPHRLGCGVAIPVLQVEVVGGSRRRRVRTPGPLVGRRSEGTLHRGVLEQRQVVAHDGGAARAPPHFEPGSRDPAPRRRSDRRIPALGVSLVDHEQRGPVDRRAVVPVAAAGVVDAADLPIHRRVRAAVPHMAEVGGGPVAVVALGIRRARRVRDHGQRVVASR